METLRDHDFDSLADHFLREANKLNRLSPPVDLFQLGQVLRVTTVDIRPMVQVGGLSVRSAGFVVYLQDVSRLEPLAIAVGTPPSRRPRLTTRQRFTFAHELGHTLLFSDSDPPQLRRGAPRGAQMESLCHRAARRFLMPPSFITGAIKERGRITSSELLDLAKMFEVSLDVLLRRCQELDLLRGSARAVLLVRTNAGATPTIAGFYSGQTLTDGRGLPAVGGSAVDWLAGVVNDDFWDRSMASTTSRQPYGELSIRRRPYGKYAYFIEIEWPETRDPRFTKTDDSAVSTRLEG